MGQRVPEHQSIVRFTANPLFLNNRVDRLFWSEDLSERLVSKHSVEITNTDCFAAIVPTGSLTI